MSEAVVAGRLEIPVESDTSGFRKALKKKIDAASKGVEATVGVALGRGEKKLRADLQAAVDKASKGVTAKIGVDVDAKALKQRLQMAASHASAGVSATIGVDIDAKTARAKVEAAAKAAGAGVTAEVDVTVDEKKARGLRDRLRVLLTGRDKPTVEVGVEEVDERTTKRWWQRTRGALQSEADRAPISVPFTFGGKKGSRNPRAGMGALRALGLLAMASVLQPIIATIGGAVGGAAAMVGNLSTMAATLSGVVPLVWALAAGIGAGAIAFTGWNAEGAEAVDSMQEIKAEVKSLKGEWDSLTHSVRHAMWDQLAGRIRPLGERLLPQLERGLSGTSRALSGVVGLFIDWLGSDRYTRQLDQTFELINGDGKKSTGVLTLIGEGLLGFAKGITDLGLAAGPILTEFSAWVADLGKRFSEKWDSPFEVMELRRFLDYAADKGQQAVRILDDLGGAIAGIFRAGRPAGDSLLMQLEQKADKLAKWVNSEDGAKKIAQWFEDTKPIAEEVGGLIADVVGALLRLAQDPNTATLIEKIRHELVPALETFFDVLGASLGPEVIDLLTNLADIMSAMGDAGGPMANALGWLNDGLDKIAVWLDDPDNKDMAATLGTILGGLLAFNALKGLVAKTGVLTLLAGTLSLLAGSLTRLKGIGKITLPKLIIGGGASAATTAGGSAVGATLGEKLFSQSVYWKRPMPVYVTNPGGTGGDTVVGDGDGDGKKKKPKKPTSRGGTGSRTGGNGTGGGSIFNGGGKDKPATGPGRSPAPSNTPRGIFGGRNPNGGTTGNSAARNTVITGGSKPRGRISRGVSSIAGGIRRAATAVGERIKDVRYEARTNGDRGSTRAGYDVRAARLAAEAQGGGKGAGQRTGKAVGKTVEKATKSGGLLGGLFGKSTGKSLGSRIKTGAGKLLKGGGVLGLVAGVAAQGIAGKVADGNGGMRDAGAAAISGGATGAGIGAMVGSIVPGVGTAIGAGVGGVIGAGVGLAKSGVDWDKVKAEASASMASVQAAVSTGWNNVKTWTSEASASVGSAVSTGWGNVKTWTSDTWSSVSTSVSTGWNNVKTWTSETAASVGASVSTGWNNVKTWTSDTWSSVSTSVSAGWGNVKTWTSDTTASVGSAVSTAWGNVKTWTSDTWASVKSNVGTAWDTVKTKTSEAAAAVGSKVSTAWSNVRTWTSNAWNNVRSSVANAAGNIRSSVSSAWDTVTSRTSSTWSSLRTAVSGAVSGALGSVAGFARSIPGYFNIDLSRAGGNIVGSLARGIRSAVRVATSAISTVVSAVRRFLPNSPVPEGPLRVLNDGGPGKKIVGMIAAGIRSSPEAHRAMADLAGDLADQDFALGSLSVSGRAARAGVTGTATPGGVIFEDGAIRVHNPVAEPASTSITSALRRVAALGAFE